MSGDLREREMATFDSHRAVRPERSGWRDESISRRHRQWGFDVPATDIDFLLAEYDQGETMAIIEYKFETAPELSGNHPSIRAVAALADRAGLPFFVVRYTRDFSWFRVVPINDYARVVQPAQPVMDELGFVSFLYELRGRSLPPDFELHRDLIV